MALNDLYVERVQGVNGVQNPNPREIVRYTLTSLTCLRVVLSREYLKYFVLWIIFNNFKGAMRCVLISPDPIS